MKTLLYTLFVFLLFACKKDEPTAPIIPNEEELITTMHFTLTPTNGGDPVVFTFTDMDGDGGEAPIISNGILNKNTTYKGMLELLNELENPVGNITEEVQEESNVHQVFYQSTLTGLSITYKDEDIDNNPLGLATLVKTEGTGSGNLTITLRHEPDKFASGVSSGDISNAGGESDIQVTFKIDVE